MLNEWIQVHCLQALKVEDTSDSLLLLQLLAANPLLKKRIGHSQKRLWMIITSHVVRMKDGYRSP